MVVYNPSGLSMEPPRTSAVFDNELNKQAEIANVSYEQALQMPKLVAAARLAEEINVFGVDAPIGPDGHRQPCGIGAPGNESGNHYRSILRFEGPAAYARAVRELFRTNPAKAKSLGLTPPSAGV